MQVVEDQQDQAVEAKQGQIKITVCLSLSGIAEGGEEVYKEFQKQITEMEANAALGERKCEMGQVGCRGYCSRDVLVDVAKQVWFCAVPPVDRLVRVAHDQQRRLRAEP